MPHSLHFDSETLSHNIKKYRKSKGISQLQLGDALGLKQNTISQYETPDKNTPDDMTIHRIAEFLEVDISILIGETSQNIQLEPPIKTSTSHKERNAPISQAVDNRPKKSVIISDGYNTTKNTLEQLLDNKDINLNTFNTLIKALNLDAKLIFKTLEDYKSDIYASRSKNLNQTVDFANQLLKAQNTIEALIDSNQRLLDQIQSHQNRNNL